MKPANAFPFTPPEKAGFAAALLAWFKENMRPLPWRETYEPYRVWISEIMLQQTQMERGVRYFNQWMRRFPDIRAVAEADEQAVLAAWEGLGYYSRAQNLHAAAKRLMREHGGIFPSSPAAIRALPGVGEYTAGAIAAIAFNLPEPAVDANVMRIFARLCDMDAPVSDREAKAFVTETVRGLIPAESPRLFCQALMELGALVCGKVPRCAACPLASCCAALRRGTVAERPRKKAEKKYALLEMTAGVVLRDGRALIHKRPAEGLWAGLWEFPGCAVPPGEEAERALRRHLAEALGLSVAVREKITTARHGYTTNRVTLHGYLCDCETPNAEPPGEYAWVKPEEIGRYAFPAGHRKLLEKLGWKNT